MRREPLILARGEVLLSGCKLIGAMKQNYGPVNLTARDREKILRKPSKVGVVLMVLVRVLKPVLWPLTQIGPIRRYLGGTIGGRFGSIYGCQKRGDHAKAADLAVQALKKFRYQRPGVVVLGGADFFWWQYMYAAVVSLDKLEDQDQRDELIELARNGIEPFEGYDVAYAFLTFARWKYQQRDFDTAIEFATVASKADATWAEPDFFMGWFCLALGRGDAMAHLSLAVDKDPRILERIVEDTVCRQHPHIIEGLRKISRDDLNSGPEGPQATG